MNKQSPSFDRLALLAQRSPHLLAGPLALYKEQEGLDDQQVAALLRCEPEALLRLALCERPRPAPHFREDVERIATYIHADMMQLARLIRAAEAREALHHRSSAVPSALLAARDQEDAEVVSTEDEDERPDE